MEIFLKWLITPFYTFKSCMNDICHTEPFSAFLTPLFALITIVAIIILWKIPDMFRGDGGRKNRPPFARV